MKTILLSAVLLLASTGLVVASDPPSCEICNLYWWDTWVLAGRQYHKNEVIGFPNDVVSSFTQQSRRGFVGWHRFYHLYGKYPNFQYAPGIEWPFECHPRLFNARINTTTFEITTDRAISPFEPIFLECLNDDFFVEVRIDNYPELDMDTLEREGRCMDDAEIRDNGVFARRSIKAEAIVTGGKLLHMHRAEFYNETSKTNEPMIKYTFGHPNSDLLLLPNFPIVSSIRHGRPANVELQWDNGVPTEEIFTNTTDIMFAEHEGSFLWAAVVALRDIKPGEELLIDFGDAYDSDPAIIQERAVPDGFFSDSWIKHERRVLASEMPQFALPKLEPGQIAPVTLTNGTKLSDGLHRIGFPDSISDTLQSWATDIGMLDHLKRYVFDKSLAIDTSERVRFNNGTWWTRRFDSEWQSNMHYIATDDDESNEQFFKALQRGGFDTILSSIGQHFNLSSLTCFYPSYIVVNHCVKSHVHSDSDYPNIFNLIFPIEQVDNGEPELILAEDDAVSTYVPYRYERNAGVLLGKDGMHGTAPTDYRDTGGVRIVVSVYMGDFSKDDDEVQQYINDWQDPPYPNYWSGQLHHALTKRVHWSKDDPTVSIGNPMPRAFPLRRPKPRKQRGRPEQYD